MLENIFFLAFAWAAVPGSGLGVKSTGASILLAYMCELLMMIVNYFCPQKTQWTEIFLNEVLTAYLSRKDENFHDFLQLFWYKNHITGYRDNHPINCVSIIQHSKSCWHTNKLWTVDRCAPVVSATAGWRQRRHSAPSEVPAAWPWHKMSAGPQPSRNTGK